MAHFRGTVAGSRGDASRLGTKTSGMRVEAQSWQGKVVVTLHHNPETGQDTAVVTLERHHGTGSNGIELYRGPVSGFLPDGRTFIPGKVYVTAEVTS